MRSKTSRHDLLKTNAGTLPGFLLSLFRRREFSRPGVEVDALGRPLMNGAGEVIDAVLHESWLIVVIEVSPLHVE